MMMQHTAKIVLVIFYSAIRCCWPVGLKVHKAFKFLVAVAVTVECRKALGYSTAAKWRNNEID